LLVVKTFIFTKSFNQESSSFSSRWEILRFYSHLCEFFKAWLSVKILRYYYDLFCFVLKSTFSVLLEAITFFCLEKIFQEKISNKNWRSSSFCICLFVSRISIVGLTSKESCQNLRTLFHVESETFFNFEEIVLFYHCSFIAVCMYFKKRENFIFIDVSSVQVFSQAQMTNK